MGTSYIGTEAQGQLVNTAIQTFVGELETSGKCGLLQQDTEVIISPKSRHGPAFPQNLQPPSQTRSDPEDPSSEVELFLPDFVIFINMLSEGK